jgi:hypothetical protein
MCSALVSALCLTAVAASTNFPIESTRQALANIVSKISLLKNSPNDVFADGWIPQLAQVHKLWKPKIVPTGQTIDVYPQHTGLVIGREGLRYSPRPAFLSLNAHTYELAMLNAHHLEERAAPDLVLFSVLPREWAVNNRHPALADGPSLPLLLSHYVPDSIGDDFLILRKRPTPLHMAKQLLMDVDQKFGESIPLPQGPPNLLWAELEIKRSVAGNIIHQMYKSPHILLQSGTDYNATHVFQIIPELGEAGFLLSPLVQDNAAFGKLYLRQDTKADAEGDTVRSIKVFSPDAPDFFWEMKFRLKLYALKIEK